MPVPDKMQRDRNLDNGFSIQDFDYRQCLFVLQIVPENTLEHTVSVGVGLFRIFLSNIHCSVHRLKFELLRND